MFHAATFRAATRFRPTLPPGGGSWPPSARARHPAPQAATSPRLTATTFRVPRPCTLPPCAPPPAATPLPPNRDLLPEGRNHGPPRRLLRRSSHYYLDCPGPSAHVRNVPAPQAHPPTIPQNISATPATGPPLPPTTPVTRPVSPNTAPWPRLARSCCTSASRSSPPRARRPPDALAVPLPSRGTASRAAACKPRPCNRPTTSDTLSFAQQPHAGPLHAHVIRPPLKRRSHRRVELLKLELHKHFVRFRARKPALPAALTHYCVNARLYRRPPHRVRHRLRATQLKPARRDAPRALLRERSVEVRSPSPPPASFRSPFAIAPPPPPARAPG